MNFKLFRRMSAKMTLAAVIVGSLTLVSCEKEKFDVNTEQPGQGQQIVVPATDLTTTNALIQQILDYIKNQQQQQLQALLDAIKNGDQQQSAKLDDQTEKLKTLINQMQDVIGKLQTNNETNQTEFQNLKNDLQQLINLINAMKSGLYQKLDNAISAITGKIDDEKTDLRTAIESYKQDIQNIENAINVLKSTVETESDDNAQAIITALKSEYSNMLQNIEDAINNYHDTALETTLKDKVNELKTLLGQINEKEFDYDVILNKMTDLLSEVKNAKQAIVEKLNALDQLNNLVQQVVNKQEAANLKLDAIRAKIESSNKELAQEFKDAIDAAKTANTEALKNVLDELQEDLPEIYEAVLEILNAETATPATVADPSGLSFIDPGYIPSVTPSIVSMSPSSLTYTVESGVCTSFATYAVPAANAEMLTAEQLDAAIAAIDAGEIYESGAAPTKKFSRAVGDHDFILAQIAMKEKLNSMAVNTWSNYTTKIFKAVSTIGSEQTVSEISSSMKVNITETARAIYCSVNNVTYYTFVKVNVAEEVETPSIEINTTSEGGEVSHNYTHSGEADHGHGTGNAGGGEGGK